MNPKCVIFTFVVLLGVVSSTTLWSCTIFCARDQHGQVWAGNNEDFYYFDFTTWIRVRPKTDSTLSFLYFGYANTPFPQGGVNEAGLFYDGNAVEATPPKSEDNKIPFPENGEHAMLLFILGHCKTVPEAIELFRRYETPWMASAQINLADRQGNMGIVTADSAWLTAGNFQVSTNYNLAHDDEDYKRCWRYPIAHSMLSSSEPDFELMTKICDSTSQRKGAITIYSNVHNLTTGEMWLYYSWDYENPYKTTFDEIVALGDTVVFFRDLFAHQTVAQAYDAFAKNGFDAALTILNTITNREVREEKLKLLSLGALFNFDSFIESGKIKISNDENLVREIITASNSEEILSLIARQDISKLNKQLVDQKLATVNGTGFRNLLLVGLVLGATVLSLMVLLRNKIWRKQ